MQVVCLELDTIPIGIDRSLLVYFNGIVSGSYSLYLSIAHTYLIHPKLVVSALCHISHIHNNHGFFK